MINLLNKLLAKFNLQITSKQEEEPQKEYSLVSLVEETVKLLDTLPKDSLNYNPSYHEEVDRKSTRLNSSHVSESRMPSSA